MGSPYHIACVSRVNVIRTSRGFLRLSRELFSITGCEFLDSTAVTVAEIMDNLAHPAWVSMVFDDDVDRGVEALKGFLIERVPSWHTFVNPYLDFCAIVISAKACNNREVVTVTTRYTFDESQRLDRAVVLDFTLWKGH